MHINVPFILIFTQASAICKAGDYESDEYLQKKIKYSNYNKLYRDLSHKTHFLFEKCETWTVE